MAALGLLGSPAVAAPTAAPGQLPVAVHHDIRLNISCREKRLDGECAIRFRGVKTQKPVPLDFELLDGEIQSVRLNGRNRAAFQYLRVPGGEKYDLRQLRVTVPARVASARSFTITVRYRDRHFYGEAINPEDDKPFSLGQIDSAGAFSSHLNPYPFLDGQGRSADISLTTDLKDAVAVSSGKLVSRKVNADRTVTYRYHTDHGSGMLPYPFAVGRYRSVETLAGDGKTRLQILYLPGDERFARQKLPVMKEIFDYYRQLFGPYPFPKLAIVETDLRRGNIGLAAQSVIMLSRSVWFARELDPKDARLTNNALFVLADEINHQWNAYKVGSPTFLAEGISRYVDSLYAEKIGGAPALRQQMADTKQSYVYLVEKAKIEDRPITDPAVYPALYFLKGALALHMLRHLLGPESFARGLRDYFTWHAGRQASLDDFRASFERVSGRSLTVFFRQWYGRKGWPKLRVSWSVRPAGTGYEVEVTVRQQQAEPFSLPGLTLVLRNGSESQQHQLTVEQREHRTLIRTPFRPTALTLDAEPWLLQAEYVNAAEGDAEQER